MVRCATCRRTYGRHSHRKWCA